ncbi:MAG: hypothetical protein ABIJ57_15770 [Pseudomonadota bacterium]
MPKAFEDAIKAGARVITKKIKGGRYIHIAYLKGKAIPGEVHTKKGK